MADDLSIRGLQEAQRWNMRALANVKPSGEFGRTIQAIIASLLRFEISVTHVVTGALRGSERGEVSGLMGRTTLDPSARNPRTGEAPYAYGSEEDLRGGSHAFGYRTYTEGTQLTVVTALAYLGRSLE